MTDTSSRERSSQQQVSNGRERPLRIPGDEPVSSTERGTVASAWPWNKETCTVRANADTAEEAAAALASGAKGIGLCRTEWMLLLGSHPRHLRSMVLAPTLEERIAALELLLPEQRSDFAAIFRVMDSMPVAIRLLDPPLTNFLPSVQEIDAQVADALRDENWELWIALKDVRGKVGSLMQNSLRMGHGAGRLSLTYPELLRLQVRAILQAALEVMREGLDPRPEIMVPLVSSENEVKLLTAIIRETAFEVFSEASQRVRYSVGALIEVPRAALCAAAISEHVDFVTFGTNDLTQATYGFSREDRNTYLPTYLAQGVLTEDPFVKIDQEGVGSLMAMATAEIRAVNPSIKIGVCGDHTGDWESVRFFHSIGVDYVSCSLSRCRMAESVILQAEELDLRAS